MGFKFLYILRSFYVLFNVVFNVCWLMNMCMHTYHVQMAVRINSYLGTDHKLYLHKCAAFPHSLKSLALVKTKLPFQKLFLTPTHSALQRKSDVQEAVLPIKLILWSFLGKKPARVCVKARAISRAILFLDTGAVCLCIVRFAEMSIRLIRFEAPATCAQTVATRHIRSLKHWRQKKGYRREVGGE